jgi:hypothetical protein
MKNFSVYLFKIVDNDDDILAEKFNHDILFEVGDIGKNMVYDVVDNIPVLICFLEKYKNDKIVDISKRHNVLISYEDITNDILFNKINISEETFFDVFGDLSSFFQIENLTIDDVLDKINISGINSLTDIDKKILTK